MKVLCFAHELEVGGTQVNAIELAAALRDLHGFEVVMFATPGPMLRLVEDKGLRFIPAPEARFHPSLARISALCDTVRRERPDLVHVWDWWQCLDAYYAVHLLMRIPMIVTDMMMDLTRILPRTLPTTFGTPAMVDRARAMGRRSVELLLPPVDVHLNAPDAIDPQLFRDKYGICPDHITLVTVSRLSEYMKGDSLFRTIEVVRALGRDFPLRLIIVGNGTARATLDQLATRVNHELGRSAVVLTGALLDPRPAYAAADIVVGMGGSALRGMAFAKPVVVVGEQGFSSLFTSRTADRFYYSGFYGRGDGNSLRLLADVQQLAEDPELRRRLGHFSRHFVVDHFSLECMSARLAQLCRGAAERVPRLAVAAADGLRTAAVYLRERRFLVPSRSSLPQ